MLALRPPHMAIMVRIVVNAILGKFCCLTTWEQNLWLAAGQLQEFAHEPERYYDFGEQASFVRRFPRDVLYVAGGAAVLVAFIAVPPRWRARRQAA